jgi:hypothetical protein
MYTLKPVQPVCLFTVCVGITASPASLTSDAPSPPKATVTSVAASTSGTALRRPSHVVHFSAAADKSATDISGRSRDTQQQQQQQQSSSKQLTADATSEATSAKGEGVYHGRRYSQSSHEVSSATTLALGSLSVKHMSVAAVLHVSWRMSSVSILSAIVLQHHHLCTLSLLSQLLPVVSSSSDCNTNINAQLTSANTHYYCYYC